MADISRIGIFCEVIRQGSFTRAAQRCGYSQSAVSQNIRALEQELGFTLVDRRKDGIRLTADGEAFYPYLQSIYAAEQELGRKCAEMSGLIGSTIRIGTFTSISRTWLPGPMAAFREHYPRVSFHLRQGDHISIPQWIREGSVDLGFINADLTGDLEQMPLYRDEIMAVLPQGHVLARKEEVTLQELAACPLILLDMGRQSITTDVFARAGLRVQPDYEVYDDYTVLEMVRRGMGVSLMYEHFLTGLAGGVQVRPVAGHPGRQVALAWRSRRTLPFAAERFLAFLESGREH